MPELRTRNQRPDTNALLKVSEVTAPHRVRSRPLSGPGKARCDVAPPASERGTAPANITPPSLLPLCCGRAANGSSEMTEGHGTPREPPARRSRPSPPRHRGSGIATRHRGKGHSGSAGHAHHSAPARTTSYSTRRDSDLSDAETDAPAVAAARCCWSEPVRLTGCPGFSLSLPWRDVAQLGLACAYAWAHTFEPSGCAWLASPTGRCTATASRLFLGSRGMATSLPCSSSMPRLNELAPGSATAALCASNYVRPS